MESNQYNSSQLTANLTQNYPKFPIYKNNGKPSIKLTNIQRQAIAAFKEKLASGLYRLEDNPCMCGASDDVCVTEKDRYGIPCRYVLCRNCGLVRQEKRLDDESTALFYRDDYRKIYTGSETATEEFFDGQSEHGESFYSLADKYIGASKIRTVFEAGCAVREEIYIPSTSTEFPYQAATLEKNISSTESLKA